MFQCHICHNSTSRAVLKSEVFQITGQWVGMEGIPARVCDRWGEAVFERETVERVRALVYGGNPPTRTVTMAWLTD